jgi:ubiquinone/menaquinone biosynthesis C-methylase UbiE
LTLKKTLVILEIEGEKMSIAPDSTDHVSNLPNNDVIKQKVQQGYDTSSDFYDDAVGQVYVQYANHLLRDLTIPDNPTALDVGCGTGIATFQLLNKCQGQGQFYGIDLSPGMIVQATQKAVHDGYTNCIFQQGDAEHLPFPNNMFDLVISNVVLQWIHDKRQALSEMYRVLTPGGQVALRFGAKGAFQESFQLLLQLATQYLNYPIAASFQTLINNFISLEQAHKLFDDVGFQDQRLYGLHQLNYVDPTTSRRSADAYSSFWKSGLPTHIIDAFQHDYINEMIKQSTAKGFKQTRYWIIAYGKKPTS